MHARTVLRAALGVAISAVACLLVVNAVDVGSAADELSSVDPRWLALPVIGIPVQFALRAARWALILRSAARTRVRVRDVAPALAVGYLTNAVMPARLGEVARVVAGSRATHINLVVVTASVLVERLIDLGALVGLAALAVGLGSVVGWMPIGGMVVLLGGPLLLVRIAGPLAARLPHRLPAILREPAAVGLAALSNMRPAALLAGLLLSTAAWLCDAVLVWLVAQAIGAEIRPEAALAIAVGAALASVLPAAGGYLGTYELGAVAFGTMVGAPSDAVLAIALISHVYAVVPLAIAGTWVLARGTVSIRGDRKARPTVVP